MIRYGRYQIRYSPKPIPSRSHDYDFEHDDYDGAPDSGDNRCGTAANLDEGKEAIEEIEREREEEGK